MRERQPRSAAQHAQKALAVALELRLADAADLERHRLSLGRDRFALQYPFAVMPAPGRALPTEWQMARENAGLSLRQCRVLQELLRGRTPKEIGKLLGISPKTVTTHCGRAQQKLNARTIATAVVALLRVGGRL